MKKIIAGIVSVVAGLGFSAQALAVMTKDCPATLRVSLGNVDVNMSRIATDDKDMLTILSGTQALASRTAIEDVLQLTEKKSGKCSYTGSAATAVVYTKEGKDLIYVQQELVPQNAFYNIAVRVYGTISALSPQIQLKPQTNFGAMLYFYGQPSGRYDGGWELRPIGSTSTFVVEAE